MKRRSIRTQLVLHFLLLAFLPLSAFTAYILWHVYRVNPGDFMQLLLILSGAFAATLIFALLLSLNLSNQFIAPIEAITAAARKLASGRLSERVHVKTGNEIDFLALALNNLASRLEDKLDEVSAEKQKLQLILEHMENAVMLFDPHGCLIEANRSALLWFHLNPAMIGQHNLNILGSSQFNLAMRESLLSGHSQQQILRTHFQGIKKSYQVSLVALPMKEEDSPGILAVFHDITSLQLLQERQSDFVANASHELATPLTAIRGFAETLVDGAAEDPETSRHFASIILSEADRMQRLVEDLLQLAKIESSEYRQQFKRIPLEAASLLDSMVRELTPVWQRKLLRVEIERPQAEVWVLTDPDRLKQILVNLMDNAIKYTPDGGTIRTGVALCGNQVRFWVSDSGIGIPAEELPRIFDRFYRLDKARSRSVGGTGLGLAIVKHLLDALDGKIEVESRPDVGTTFRFTLPAAMEKALPQ